MYKDSDNFCRYYLGKESVLKKVHIYNENYLQDNVHTGYA